MRVFIAFLLAVVPTLAQQDFYPFTVDQDHLGGAPDFSSLNHPLTAADRVFVRDGHFFTLGADLRPNTSDDRRLRLFGVNFAFGANFPETADAPRIAKRLRRLGVNLVRCHHMDTSPDRDPQTANSLLTTGPYPTLNPVSVARLRHFLDALRAEGIYINLNLHVGYKFRPDIDQVPPVPGLPFPNHSKPLHIFFPRMIDLQVEYTRQVIDALCLKDDPVLAMVEIDNETSLLEAWQRNTLDTYAIGEYAAELEKQWNAFKPGAGPPVAAKNAATDARAGDYLRFLADRDRAYMKRMREAVRANANPLIPVAGTQMGYGGLLNLDAQAALDYQDNHFYIDHYNFPHASWDAHDWRIRDASAVGSGLSSFLNMAAAREAGKPYTVSEFNQPWPNRHAAEIDPALAAFGAFQDWDAIVHFAYSHSRRWDNLVPGGFDINSDWTKFPNIGQSAFLFRSGAVETGKAPLRIAISAAMQLEAGREKRNGNIAAFLAAATGFDPAIALAHPIGLVRGNLADRMPAVLAPYLSDTGQLVYDPARKTYLVKASQAAGAFGFLGKEKHDLGSLDVQLGASAGDFAAILITALDGKPLAASTRLLISTPGYTLGTQPGEPPRMQKLVLYTGAKDWWTLEPDSEGRPSGDRNGSRPPIWMERVESHLTFRSNAKTIAVYPLDGAGARREALPPAAVKRAKDAFEIHLQAEGQQFAPWYEVAANW